MHISRFDGIKVLVKCLKCLQGFYLNLIDQAWVGLAYVYSQDNLFVWLRFLTIFVLSLILILAQVPILMYAQEGFQFLEQS